MSNVKCCSRCKIERPLSEYHKNSRKTDGLQPACRFCISNYSRLYYNENCNRLREVSRKYYHDNINNRQEYRRNYCKLNSTTVASYRKRRCDFLSSLSITSRAPKEKSCRTCKSVQPYSKFYIDRYSIDGLRSQCKECSNSSFSHWKLKNKLAWRNISIRAWHSRRARIKQAFVEPVDINILGERDSWSCGICGMYVSEKTRSIDHIIPLSRMGEHSYNNTQIAHIKCNMLKGSKL